jgi:hypothetical protein
MSISSLGSTPSFWQQDQSYWQQAQSNDSSTAATDSVINAMSSAETSLGKGLAGIANRTALNRVNSQLTAAIQSILSGGTGSSSASSTGSSSSSSSSSKSTAAPATGTGTATLSINTPLSNLGVLAGGSITISAGPNMTSYTSTGADTVGDLMNAINADDYGNAAVTASLNSHGSLVLTSKNDSDTIAVGGVYAGNIGFGVTNDTFAPTKGTPSSSTAPTTSSDAGTSATSSASKSTSSAKSSKSYSTLGSEISSSAASLLSDSGVGGTLVDMLA